jgi:uncharacterized protein YbjT (DUF2867 family)
VILVIGGRSKIGAALIGDLLARGQRVRALVRAGEPTVSMPAGVETVTGDLAGEGSLVGAMEGAEKVFLLSSPHPGAVRWHRNAIDAARRTDMQLLMRSSIIGANRESNAEFISAHTACDRYLTDSGLPHVIVRPNLFLQNIPESTIPSIDASGNFYVDAGQVRLSMVDTRDVAAVAARPHRAWARQRSLRRHRPRGAFVHRCRRQAHRRDGTPDHVCRRIPRRGAPRAAACRADWVVRERPGRPVPGLPPLGTGGYAAQVTDTVERLTGRRARSLDDLLTEIGPGLQATRDPHQTRG